MPARAGLGSAAYVVWLAFRIVGSVILVPIVEEFAFRGYLHRKLISERFESVAEGQFSWLAFVGSSVLFGLVHDRWLAGGLAGVVFAIALYRSGRLSDAIAAHMSANAVIIVWAIAAGEWGLL